LSWRLEDDVLVRSGGADVGQLLPLGDVDLHVAGAGVLADDHPLVDLDARADEERASLLEIVERVGDGNAVRHADHDAPVAASDRPGPRAVPRIAVVQRPVPAGVSQELAAIAEEAARRDVEDEAREAGRRARPSPRAAHLAQLAASRAQLLDDDGDVRL